MWECEKFSARLLIKKFLIRIEEDDHFGPLSAKVANNWSDRTHSEVVSNYR